MDLVESRNQVSNSDCAPDAEIGSQVGEAEDDLATGTEGPSCKLRTGEYGDDVAENGRANTIEEQDKKKIREMVPAREHCQRGVPVSD